MIRRRSSVRSLYRRCGKRALDLLVTPFAVLMLCPLMILIGMVILVVDGSPVLFRQDRPGLGGKRFTLLKFRTMHPSRDARGVLHPDARRLSRLGTFLRNTSLDELPTLLNVIAGDMSLVGPRPLLTDYLPRYTRRQMRRSRPTAN